ncbi:DUF4180 domain-containing protein [Chondromyces crocatus]|uniref:DUF4180 domain-containing protein n=1 Tax=Chondromyces crocatus TaxID=52 RepID=A0A0K1EFK8_CHOCO|nr:DUF4180 domain-containing protein [Chondromyces crocatus]AKT39482.1 uncharacterized protein CMC5_036290 [Chondromyces crocatus]
MERDTRQKAELSLLEADDTKIVEGQPGLPFMSSTGDTNRLLEELFFYQAEATLLYAANLTGAFFDLSSGEAGEILHKLRLYRIRLAVVWRPGDPPWSSRFGELMAEEQRSDHFGIFETREAALAWLTVTREPPS